MQSTIVSLTETPCAVKHNAARCLSCMIDNILLQEIDGVDALRSHGFIDADMQRAYRHVWAISAKRDSAWDQFKAYPETAEAQKIANIMTRRLPNPSYL